MPYVQGVPYQTRTDFELRTTLVSIPNINAAAVEVAVDYARSFDAHVLHQEVLDLAAPPSAR